MMITLPIPIYFNNEVYSNSIEIKKPNAGCIADTKKLSDAGDQYGAIAFFISSCIEAIETKTDMVTDRGMIKNAVRNMPYRSAEYVFIKIMLLRHSDDGVEGVYNCPRCRTQIVCEAIKENGEIIKDTRDFIKDMPVKFIDGLSNISYTFTEPIVIKATDGSVLQTIESFVMRHSTLGDAISGIKRADARDDLRSQFGIYVESLVEVNGDVVDSRFKGTYGMLMFERADLDTDIIEISKLVNEFGMDKRVTKRCPNCEKEWRSIVNTSNFFALEALLS